MMMGRLTQRRSIAAERAEIRGQKSAHKARGRVTCLPASWRWYSGPNVGCNAR